MAEDHNSNDLTFDTISDQIQKLFKEVPNTHNSLKSLVDQCIKYSMAVDEFDEFQFMLLDTLMMIRDYLTNNNTNAKDLIKVHLEKVNKAELVLHPWVFLYPSTYPLSDLENFQPGTTGRCLIGESQWPKQGVFYMIEDKCLDRVGGLDMMDELNETIKSTDEINDGDLIGVDLPELSTRAICAKSASGIRIFLLDIGEELGSVKDVKRFFKLSDEQAQIPAHAVFCKLMDDSLNEEEAEDLLIELKLNLAKFTVVQVKNSVVYVKLTPHKIKKVQKAITSPKSVQSSTNSTKAEPKSNSNNPVCDGTSDDINDTRGAKCLTLTEEERRILFEETPSTSNALQAVMGFVPKDEARLCKFYNGVGETCYKGATCRFVHQKPLEDGWTRDQEMVSLNSPVELPLLNVNEEAIVTVTHVENFRTFYGHLISSSIGETGGAEFVSLQEYINRPEVVAHHRPYSKQVFPAMGEVILIRHSDNQIYRAKLIAPFDEGTNSAEVIFVDYGLRHCTPLVDMYKWEPAFANLPFQAIKFVIGDLKAMRHKSETRYQAKLALKRLILEKNVNVHVLSNNSDLIVKVSMDDVDVSQVLIAEGWAQQSDPLAPKDDSTYRPA